MKAKFHKNALGLFIVLVPSNKKEKDLLCKLWDKLPDITFEKRGSVSGTIPIKEHSFCIKVNWEIENEEKTI